MTGADLATAADVERVLARQDALEAKLDRVLAALPTSWLSLTAAAERMGVDPRTITAAISRGEVVGRRVGRRWVVDANSIRPASAAAVAAMARGARAGR